jgi:hypothetical protein
MIRFNSEDITVHVDDVDLSQYVRTVNLDVLPTARLTLPDFPNSKSFGPIAIEGTYDDGEVHLVQDGDKVPVSFEIDSRRFAGVSWYRETHETQAIPHLTDDGISMTLVGPVTTKAAEWWRRAGFWLLSKVMP